MKTIVGTWQNPDGTPAAGARVFFDLSQDAVALGVAQIGPSLVSFTLDNTGSLPANTRIWFNDELTPSGTIYTVAVILAGGGVIYGPENLSITGASPFNINNAQPTTQNVMLANPVVTNPTAQQTINGFPLVLENANLGFSGVGSSTGDIWLSRVAANSFGMGSTSGASDGSLTLGILIANKAIEVSGSSGLPTVTTSNLWFAGGFGTPNLGRIFIGDGTGWQLNFSKRIGSVTTDLITFFDTGKITLYGGIVVTGNGVPSIPVSVDSTGLTAAVGTTTLYAVPASGAGQYLVQWNAKVTTVAGVSSTLGALTIVYTDPDSTVQTIVATAQTRTSAIAATETTNTTAAVLLGMPLLLNCKASTNITYAMAYASNAANVMTYNLHIKLSIY